MKVLISELKKKVINALVESGCSKSSAKSVAKALITAEAEGNPSHGISRLEYYIAQIHSQKLNPKSKIKTHRPFPATIQINADCGFAYPAIDKAIDFLSKKTKKYGIASASIYNSHHCGSLGCQVQRLAKNGLMGIMVANTPKAMSAFGSKEAIFGTNPIAFAAPTKDDALVIDLSLSKIARGKIVNAEKKGDSIANNVAIDKNGNLTTNPSQALSGSLLPIDLIKGSNLALMVEVLASAHTGSQPSFLADSFFDDKGKSPRVGQFLIAIYPGNKNSNLGYSTLISDLLLKINSIEGARIPGKRRIKNRKFALENGIEIDENHFLFQKTHKP